MHSLTLPFTLLLTSLVATNAQDDAPRRPNIVWILTDDMHPYIKHHVSDQHPIAGKTPNLAALQDNGVTMTNTHCSQTTCGPSRASFLSGRYPDTLKIWNFDKYLPEVHPGIVTIPKYFKNLGYDVQTFGKVFHPHMINGNDVYESLGHYDEEIRADDDRANSECGGGFYCWDQDDTKFTDYKIHNNFKNWLNSKDRRSSYMAIIGLRRPHTDFSSPYDTYTDVDFTKLQAQMSSLTRHIDNVEGVEDDDHSLAKYTCVKMDRKKVQYGTSEVSAVLRENQFSRIGDKSGIDYLVDNEETALLNIRRAYFASIVWVDEIVGKIVDTVKSNSWYTEDNTIIIFSSDHGLQNGEHGIFCKNTLFETATKVPMILQGAGIPKDKQYDYPVQLIDLFPTLIDLVDGPALDDPSGLGLDGRSFQPVLDHFANASSDEQVTPYNYASYTLYPRCSANLAEAQIHPCTKGQAGNPFNEGDCDRPQIFFMGYTIRTKTHRYTEWREFNEIRLSCQPPTWTGIPAALRNSDSEKYTKWSPESGTKWDVAPIQREMYVYDNVVDNLNVETENLAFNPTPENLALMESFSNMIQLKFNDQEPCSGRGFLDMVTDQCECLPGWFGENCDTDVAPTASPTVSPTTVTPTASPTTPPTFEPVITPTKEPTSADSVPTEAPTSATQAPTVIVPRSTDAPVAETSSDNGDAARPGSVVAFVVAVAAVAATQIR